MPDQLFQWQCAANTTGRPTLSKCNSEMEGYNNPIHWNVRGFLVLIDENTLAASDLNR